MSNYARLPVTFERGEGAWLWDTSGKKYLDALSGIAVCGLGHAHPAVTEAVCEQAGKLLHTSNLYGIPLQDALATELTRVAGMDKAFFCNSGAEANEAAIKLARLHGHSKGISEPAIIVAQNSFHGRTMATLSATGNRKIQNGFEPLVPGFIHVPFDDITAIDSIAEKTSDVIAVLLEPIQGESGINTPAENYLQAVRSLCDEHGWLMMLDEIQTGMGRTGQWFAYQHSNITPDVLTVAKGLANGVPIGACLARDKAADIFQPGHHGSTFGGTPLACSAALAVIRTIDQQQLQARAAALGKQLMSGLHAALGNHVAIREIRGKGLMIGIELADPCSELVKIALDQGLLISVQSENVVRLLPALIISDEEADLIIERVSRLILDFINSQ